MADTGVMINTAEPIWVIQINRPDRRNALDSLTAKNITFMLEEASAGSACRAIVLTGAGKWFCAGSDLKELVGQEPTKMAEIEKTKAALARAIRDACVPVIAAVSGFALGGGLSIAAACDYVIAERNSRWHMPEVANGWLPPWGIEPVIDRCGELRAKHVLWGVEPMLAEDAQAIGLVDQVCPEGGAFEQARLLADKLSKLPPAAARSVKPYVSGSVRRSTGDADERASHSFMIHCATQEARLTFAKFGNPR